MDSRLLKRHTFDFGGGQSIVRPLQLPRRPQDADLGRLAEIKGFPADWTKTITMICEGRGFLCPPKKQKAAAAGHR